MSAARQRAVQVDVTLDENADTDTVHETREIPDRFDEIGEHRLWEDGAGRYGYVLDDGTYYFVYTAHVTDDWVIRHLPRDDRRSQCRASRRSTSVYPGGDYPNGRSDRRS